jgi:hypothetical protein
VDEALPLMIEEGLEWEAHVRTKVHRRLAAKKAVRKHAVDIPTARGNGDRAQGDLVSNVDDHTASLNDIFVT